jgi:hypothetical protein
MDDAALADIAQIFRGHSQKLRVLRQELAGRRLKQGETARQAEAQPGEDEERPSVADKRLQKSTRFWLHLHARRGAGVIGTWNDSQATVVTEMPPVLSPKTIAPATDSKAAADLGGGTAVARCASIAKNAKQE